jgi:uncharacterized membrane protein YjfL (UPF0719 family)
VNLIFQDERSSSRPSGKMDILFLFVWSGIALFILWRGWFSRLLRPSLVPVDPSVRLSLAGLPLICAAFLLAVLLRCSAATVRSDRFWVSGYFVFGAAWIGASQWIFGILGIGMRDDVIERRNTSAAWVVAGQFLASTLCFAGANVGNGPGPEVVVFCALLSSATLLLTWFLFDRIASATETITIERDSAAGIRVAGWFTAAGIVCGAAVTGDWHDVSRTMSDFARYIWPIVVFSVATASFERVLRKSPALAVCMNVPTSAVVAAVSVGLAVAFVWKRGLH